MSSLALLPEVLTIGGVALDLVGAVVLSHTHNAESVVELREEIGAEGRAVGEEDAISTHAQLLAEKRVGFIILALGLFFYLVGLILKTSESVVAMAGLALGVLALGSVATVFWVKVGRRRTLAQFRKAAKNKDEGELPEQ